MGHQAPIAAAWPGHRHCARHSAQDKRNSRALGPPWRLFNDYPYYDPRLPVPRREPDGETLNSVWVAFRAANVAGSKHAPGRSAAEKGAA